MDKPITEKPIFSFKEFIYVLSLAIGFFIQDQRHQTQIHDAIVEMGYSKKEMLQTMAFMQKDITAHDRRLNWVTERIGISAIKPKEIKIESE